MTTTNRTTAARRHVAALAAGLSAAALALGGCGDDAGDTATAAPAGWATLRTASADVSYPHDGAGGYREQSDAQRSRYNAAAAYRTDDDGTLVSSITVQRDFTHARDVEEAAIAAEAGIQLGATPAGTKPVHLHGTDDARRVDFDYDSSGEQHTPPKGTPIHGVILTGLDSHGTTYAVRIDAQEGVLSDAQLAAIVDSIDVH